MCGIFGFISEKTDNPINFFDKSIYALRQLQNRGYDSAGACCIVPDNSHNSNTLVLRKYATTTSADSIDRLEKDAPAFQNALSGIAHNRWATHGAKTDLNAHPHLDHTGRIALVHNGIIENYYELKTELESHGIICRSETDTEVVSNLISYYYAELGHMTESIMKAISRLRGTWALVILCLDKPDRMYCARHGSALLVGFGDHSILVSSEQAGFGSSVSNYICLNDQDITVVRRINNKVKFENMHNYELKKITTLPNELSPEPYSHWTIKEIHEQYESSIRAISFGGRLMSDDLVKLGGLSSHTAELKQAEHLILLGCGTSLNAAKHAVQYFKDLTNLITITAFDGSEFLESDIPRNRSDKTVVIFLSQSGETKDLYRALKICKAQNILLTVGVINVVDSMIAREVDCGCYLNAGREVGVASTKAFTSQVILLSMIAINFAQIHNINQKKRARYIKSLRQLSQNIRETIADVDKSAQSVAQILLDAEHMFVLGKGPMISVAEEGSLKIKEIGYLHAEAYGGNALRHGPYALIEQNTPILFVCPSDSSFVSISTTSGESYFSLMNNTIEEVKSRDALTIIITDAQTSITKKVDHIITVGHNAVYSGILHNIPLQLIAYYLAILKKVNPDQPRHLSKCVSV